MLADSAQEQLLSLINAIPASIFVVEVQSTDTFRYIACNSHAQEATDWRSVQIQGKRPEDLLPSEAAQRVVARYRRCIEAGLEIESDEDQELEGGVRWLHTSVSPMRDNQERIVRLLVTGVAAPTSPTFGQELLKLYDHDGRLLANLPDHVLIVDHQYRIVYINHTAPGFDPKDVLGVDCRTLIFPDDRDTYTANHDRCLGEGAVVESSLRDLHGRHYLSRLVPLTREGPTQYVLSLATDVTNLKETEAALLRSQKRYELVSKGANDGIWEWDIINDHVVLSARYCELLGFRPGELDGPTSKTWDQIHPAEVHSTRAAVERHLERETPYDLELRLRTKSGEYKWFRSRACAERNEQGEPVRMVGSIQDINEQRGVLTALAESEKRFRLLAENVPGVVYLCRNDARYTMLYLNHGVEELTGYSREDFLQDRISFVDLYHPEDTERIVPLVDAALKKREPFHLRYRLKRKDGAVRWIQEIGVGVFEGDQLTYLEGFLMDVTHQELATRELHESRQFIEHIAHASPHIMYVFDVASRRNVYANRQIARDLGYTPEQIRDMGGEFLTRLTHPEDQARLATLLTRWDTADDGEILEVEYRMRHADGNWHWFLGRDTVFNRDTQGRVTQIVGTAQDITERKNLEDQLRQSQKMESVGRLAGGVAHDFNNLLTAIMGYLDMAEGALPPRHTALEAVDNIRKSSERAAELTQQLLAFARRQVIQPRVVNLNQIILHMEKLLRRLIGEQVQLETHTDPGLAHVLVDPNQIEQVLMNMSVNARDAMLDGGTLTIETRNTELDEDYVQQYPEVVAGPYVQIAVSDTGVGMPKGVIERIFDPFFTTKPKGEGTGLGLAMCFGIVKQNNGHISVYSEEGRGTTFNIYLPRASGDPDKPKPDTRVEVPPGEETILVVEDDPLVRQVCVALLGKRGYKVLAAENGEHALRVAEAHAGAIHLLLTDIVMPKMGGKELAEKLGADRPDLKVLFVSGYTENAIVHQQVLDEGIHFVQKPFTATQLASAVYDALHE